MVTVDIVLFEGVDELDFCGPFEVLASCHKLVDGHWSDRPAFMVQTVAEFRSPVRTAHGLSILSDRTFDRATEADIIIVPGGPGARNDHLPLHIIEFLQHGYDTAEVVACVSTGAYILGKAGLLDKRQVTTHHARVHDLQSLYPKAKIVDGPRVLVDKPGRLISCSGISSGVDLGLALIERYHGKETATLAAKRINWPIPLPTV